MAPTTRQTERPFTPDRETNPGDYDTIKKTRFFEAWDSRTPSKSLRKITSLQGIDKKTGSNWLKQRRELGSAAYRRSRPRSEVLGRRSRIQKKHTKTLVNHEKNPVRGECLKVQIEYFNLRISARQLQRRLDVLTNGARMYKAAYYKDELSEQTKQARQDYGNKHDGKTVENFWQWVYFTDEFHFDPTAQKEPYLLRERGTRYNLENVVPREPKQGVVLHAAGWVNWHSKCEELIFWYDEKVEEAVDKVQHEVEEVIQQERGPRPKKPRRRPTTESPEEYEGRLRDYEKQLTEWEDRSPIQPITQPKGNSITQRYYSEHLLPVYIDAIKHAQSIHGHQFYLVEDGDPSHGMKRRGIAQRKRDSESVINLIHPPSSPDLNPSEAAWNIWKQRMRRIPGLKDMTIEQLKEVGNKVWREISMKEVQDRIKDMPERCHILTKNGGERIKGRKW